MTAVQAGQCPHQPRHSPTAPEQDHSGDSDRFHWQPQREQDNESGAGFLQKVHLGTAEDGATYNTCLKSILETRLPTA